MTLTEEQRDAVAFDLEKARASIAHYRIENPSNVDTESALKELVDQANLAEDAIAEIEWLRAYLEQSERVIEAGLDVIDQQAARIKSLKKEIRRLKHESKVEQEFTNSYIKRLHDAEARIKELEEAHKRSGAKYAKIINELRSSVYANIPGLDVGKIGPDADAKPREGLYGKYRIAKVDGSPVDPNADYFVLRLDSDPVARRAALQYSYMTPDRTLAIGLQEKLTKYNPKMEDCINLQFFGMEKPRIWQITEEEKRALSIILEYISYDADDDIEICSHAAVLRAMLREAE